MFDIKEKLIIVDLIELGIKSGEDGAIFFTRDEYKTWRAKLCPEAKFIADKIRNNCFSQRIDKKVDGEVCYFRLHPEYYFNYIDHLELVEARKSALEARKFSIVAIVISIIAILIGIFMPLDLKESTVESIGKAVAENVKLAE